MTDKIKISFFLLLFFFIPLTMFCERLIEDELFIESARLSAIGGPHVAFTDDFSVLFTNPAGFQSVEAGWNYCDLTITTVGPIFDIVNVILEGDLADIPGLIRGMYAGIDVVGPISFGYIGDGLGIGFFNTTGIFIENTTPMTVELIVDEEILLCSGYSFRMPIKSENHILDIGFLLKCFIKGEIVITTSVLDLMSIDAGTLMSEPFYLIAGIGLDLGILYSYKGIFTVGMVGKDVFTPVRRTEYSNISACFDGSGGTSENGIVPFNFAIGIEYNPELKRIKKHINDFRILLDYNDIFDFIVHPETSKHPLLHIGLGLEIKLLKILSLRGGLYQGLLSAGFGVELGVFTLNIAMFGREFSSEPGLKSVYNIQIGLEFQK